MAQGLTNLAEHLNHALQQCAAAGEFKPAPFYDKADDSLVYYERNIRSYARRVNQFLTFFLACDDDTLVGLKVKSVKTIVKATEGLGAVTLAEPVAIAGEDGEEIDLAVMVRCSLVPSTDEPVSGRDYDQVEKITKGVRIHPSQLCPA